MRKNISLFIFTGFILLSQAVFAETRENDQALFLRIFADWTAAFNQKNLASSCRLFAKSVIASFQGVPEKNYDSICNGFKKIFASTDTVYRYRFKLHQVYRQGDLAAARITWYLDTVEKGKPVLSERDEGLDIFQKTPEGEWQIIQYLAYPVANSTINL